MPARFIVLDTHLSVIQSASEIFGWVLAESFPKGTLSIQIQFEEVDSWNNFTECHKRFVSQLLIVFVDFLIPALDKLFPSDFLVVR
jgi:hypothetical protein